jgi:hypothetical protein
MFFVGFARSWVVLLIAWVDFPWSPSASSSLLFGLLRLFRVASFSAFFVGFSWEPPLILLGLLLRFGMIFLIYFRGRLPSSGFSDWPAQSKKTEKNGRLLKIFIHRSELQAGTSDDDGHRESQLIGALTRPRPTTACSGQLAPRKRRGGCSGGRRRHASTSVC